MIAFDIYLDGQFVCRAALIKRHVLAVILSIAPSGKNNAAKLQVMGNDMEALVPPKEAPKTPPSKEKMIEMMHAISDQGIQKWLQQKLDKEFKVEILIVEAEPESITPPEIIKIEMDEKQLNFLDKSFGAMFPPAQD